jgi:hypothetical protein
MAETDAELVDRLAKRHSVSPAAVQVVITAFRNGGADGSVQPCRFRWHVAVVA